MYDELEDSTYNKIQFRFSRKFIEKPFSDHFLRSHDRKLDNKKDLAGTTEKKWFFDTLPWIKKWDLGDRNGEGRSLVRQSSFYIFWIKPELSHNVCYCIKTLVLDKSVSQKNRIIYFLDQQYTHMMLLIS